jgi:hypothetical protein
MTRMPRFKDTHISHLSIYSKRCLYDVAYLLGKCVYGSQYTGKPLVEEAMICNDLQPLLND